MEDDMKKRDMALGAALQMAIDVLSDESKRAAQAGDEPRAIDALRKAMYLDGMLDRGGVVIHLEDDGHL